MCGNVASGIHGTTTGLTPQLLPPGKYWKLADWLLLLLFLVLFDNAHSNTLNKSKEHDCIT